MARDPSVEAAKEKFKSGDTLEAWREYRASKGRPVPEREELPTPAFAKPVISEPGPEPEPEPAGEMEVAAIETHPEEFRKAAQKAVQSGDPEAIEEVSTIGALARELAGRFAVKVIQTASPMKAFTPGKDPGQRVLKAAQRGAAIGEKLGEQLSMTERNLDAANRILGAAEGAVRLGHQVGEDLPGGDIRGPHRNLRTAAALGAAGGEFARGLAESTPQLGGTAPEAGVHFGESQQPDFGESQRDALPADKPEEKLAEAPTSEPEEDRPMRQIDLPAETITPSEEEAPAKEPPQLTGRGESRVLSGVGGWAYREYEDGTIQIVGAPEGRRPGAVLTKAQPRGTAYEAIAEEIAGKHGAFRPGGEVTTREIEGVGRTVEPGKLPEIEPMAVGLPSTKPQGPLRRAKALIASFAGKGERKKGEEEEEETKKPVRQSGKILEAPDMEQPQGK